MASNFYLHFLNLPRDQVCIWSPKSKPLSKSEKLDAKFDQLISEFLFWFNSVTSTKMKIIEFEELKDMFEILNQLMIQRILNQYQFSNFSNVSLVGSNIFSIINN